VQKEQEGEEKHQETKVIFEGVYLSNSLADWAKISNCSCHNLRKFPQRNWLVFVGEVSSYRCVKMEFSWFQ